MTTWLNLIAIASGGALGSVCRYIVTIAAAAFPGGSTMLGTTVANILGCAAIGAFASFLEVRHAGLEPTSGQWFPEPARLAIQVGFLGGFTTFSTFVAEKNMLFQGGRIGHAFLYLAANLLLGWLVLVLAAGWVKSWMS
ncbi:fluoride efflux transporter FluC [Rubripirellula amarantea]|nr:CrcB family protein [Rubripirellula amarantea]